MTAAPVVLLGLFLRRRCALLVVIGWLRQQTLAFSLPRDSTRRLTRRDDEGHTFRLALRQQSSANYAGLTIFVSSKYFKPKYDKIFCIVNAASQQG